MDPATCERVRWLITRHERPGDDSALALLNDADALSFFSFSSSGFSRYFSPSTPGRRWRTRSARLRPEHHARLERIRLPPAVRGLLDALQPSSGLTARERSA